MKIYNIYYIAEADFSIQNAVTNRIINNVKAFAKENCKITIIGASDITEMNYKGIALKNVRKGKGIIQKFFYFSFRGFFVKKLLEKEAVEPDVVIFYSYSSRFLLPLLSYLKKKDIKMVCDLVEWYNPSHLPLGKFGPFALDLYISMKYLISKFDGVIVISTFLQNYCVSRNLKTIRVPVLVDTEIKAHAPAVEVSFDKTCLNLIYAGIPGRKDLIKNVIEAVETLNRDGLKVLFHILGLTLSELNSIYNIEYPHAIICHGVIEQQYVPEYLRQADFSVLLRPVERYSKAGFPTKFVESFNASLPVIANLTSDLSMYLKDGYNGFVVNEPTTRSLIEVLKKISIINKGNLDKMKHQARSTAVNNFDYRLYSAEFSQFFNQIGISFN